jgi:RNA recognition motif-containing protein
VSGKVVKTLIVRNLPRGADDLEALLRSTFEPYGAVRDVYIPKNMDASSPYFGTIKGFALVKFAELASAYSAAAVSLRIGRNNLSVEFAKEDR